MSTRLTDDEPRAALARAEEIQGSARLASVNRAVRPQRRTRLNAGRLTAAAAIGEAVGSILTALLIG